MFLEPSLFEHRKNGYRNGCNPAIFSPWPRSQVVRRRFAKPLYIGSTPIGASNFIGKASNEVHDGALESAPKRQAERQDIAQTPSIVLPMPDDLAAVVTAWPSLPD